MRFYGFALAGMLLGQTPAVAQQQPGQAPPQAPAVTLDARDPLDALLMHWEREIKKIETFAAQIARTTDDKTFQTTDVYVGTVKYMKPGLAKLEMKKQSNPAVEEKYVFTGTYLYQCLSQSKKIYYQQLPPPRPGAIADDNFLSLLFGTKAEEVKRRYALKFSRQPDQHYYYIHIIPRFPPDRADFLQAELVLLRDSYLPRRLWLERPNRNTEMWDIAKIETNLRLDRLEFEKPAVPPGWKIEEMSRQDAAPPQPQPRVIRQTQP